MGLSIAQHLSWLANGYQRVGTSAEKIQAPDGTKLVWIEPAGNNTGIIYVGPSTVTAPTAGVDDLTTGLELDSGFEHIEIPVPVGGLYAIGTNANDDVTWVAFG